MSKSDTVAEVVERKGRVIAQDVQTEVGKALGKSQASIVLSGLYKAQRVARVRTTDNESARYAYVPKGTEGAEMFAASSSSKKGKVTTRRRRKGPIKRGSKKDKTIEGRLIKAAAVEHVNAPAAPLSERDVMSVYNQPMVLEIGPFRVEISGRKK